MVSVVHNFIANTNDVLTNGNDITEKIQFHTANDLSRLLEQILKVVTKYAVPDLDALKAEVSIQITELNDLLNSQVNLIIHSCRFQRLEASWSGLEYLCSQADGMEKVKIKLLDLSLKELEKDFSKAIDFDQSQLYKKIYSQEYDMAGGEPFGVLLGDYYFSHKVTEDRVADSLNVLRNIAQVSAEAFSPFISSVQPDLFGLEDYSGLSLPMDFELTFCQSEYFKWNSLRSSLDTRFVGLVLPRVLMRRKYSLDSARNDGFNYEEPMDSRQSTFLWGNACYAFGSVLINGFNKFGWFADIRGSSQGPSNGGVVNNLIVDHFETDKAGCAQKYTTDVLITDIKESILSDLGFIPLSHSKDTPYAVFYSNQSLYEPSHYETTEDKKNKKLSSMLQYILCISRFAHYIKVIGRDKIGSFIDVEGIEEYIRKWLMDYTIASEPGSYEMRARYPLAESKVEMKEIPGNPGIFGCIIHLKPHAQLDQMMSSIKLVTQFASTNKKGYK